MTDLKADLNFTLCRNPRCYICKARVLLEVAVKCESMIPSTDEAALKDAAHTLSLAVAFFAVAVPKGMSDAAVARLLERGRSIAEEGVERGAIRAITVTEPTPDPTRMN